MQLTSPHSSLRKNAALVLLILFIVSTGAARAVDWTQAKAHPALPVLHAESKSCGVVFKAAQAAFQSDEPDLVNATSNLKNKGYGLILAPTFDQPPFPVPWEDQKYVEPIKLTRENITQVDDNCLFWQKAASDGLRFVILKRALSNTEVFLIYLVDEAIPHDKAVSVFYDMWKQPGDFSNIPQPAIGGIRQVGRFWFVLPWLFRDAGNGQVFAVTHDAPGPDLLEHWVVYGATRENGDKPSCVIQFTPDGTNKLDEYSRIQKGALHDLAEALGNIIPVSSPRAEMQPYREQAFTALGDMLFRPWAIRKPHITRSSAEARLRRTLSGASNAVTEKNYANYKAVYPAAVDQLTAYYAHRFALSTNEAKTEAARALDWLIRDYCAPDQ
jgi:hypothetical protein